MLALPMVTAVLPDAFADVALLRNGRSLTVTDFRRDGDRIVLMMEGGGQIALLQDQVVAIRRDEAGDRTQRPVPVVPQASPDGTSLAPPPEPVLNSGPPDGAKGLEEDGPIEIGPGEVFDRQALRDLAARIARRHRVDEALVLAVIEVESRYDAFAVSPRGAMGLMQLMPQTAARFAVGNAFNPVENLDGGVRYLKELLERYSGQVRLALAAYNAGEQAVDRFGGIPPFRETEQYVVRVTRALSR
jgi:transglycosylase-like protein with SLT domain